ncbi:MAG TPA: alpha/beta fold hydrolase [Thermoanaerobaculia bacterium]|jgi:2-succinyl-6-hydroxy-2,4-cyclohexadiene-1-carboxylate synthase|nr:alpha/beta fold hydrolase [Thermoanaerobaculia bacterium]
MIVALHGFLGRPADWDFLRDAGFDVDARELDDIPRSGDTILGYSMGGRLALHALFDGATYKRAVIISSGLGIEGERERAARREEDEKWARRFESEDWETVMRDWNAQPLFGGHVRVRRERDYDRRGVLKALRDYSPATLPPLAPRLHEIEIPVLWIAGERDAKYVAEAERAVSLLPNGELWICPGAAHRVPWEQPDALIARLRLFV